MEAHGSPVAKLAQKATRLLPDASAALDERVGIDRLGAPAHAIDLVRRGGTISLIGVYGGTADPLPMLDMFDKQIQIRMGQAQRAALGRRHHAAADATTTRSASTTSRPTRCRSTRRRDAYEMFQKKQDGAIKILLEP